MPSSENKTCSYLLRLWHTGETGSGWRAMLQSVAEPGEQHYFKDLESLTAYLLAQQDALSAAKGDATS